MTDRFNTIAGWALFAGIIALGLSILSGMFFHADKPEAPEVAGYPIEAEEEGAADAGPSFLEVMATADASAGERVFAKCVSCHTIEQGGANGIGPNLHGVIGEPIGQGAGGFAFSGALSSIGGEWTFEQMDEWLKSPRSFAPGTKMSFAGLSSMEDRANVIAYLNANGSNLPLPEVQAAPAEEEAAEAAEGEAAESGEEAAEGEAEEATAA
ncbi:cytochrome c [Altererythrobacter atlanticus]|uniref:Cytochrome c-552 n=1 Tax=Croceibacterium atlanticum TaxID=1267766 RepID=A0A0F7KSS9_9SPHN|nr:cytochrome c family protein [Croceibacterium atlanticum]AKH42644.1 Cytochrome c-552 [Croceibacterium atlanticum]MBB5731421.1 cytochrome c [Croceibacterium atlanticum]